MRDPVPAVRDYIGGDRAAVVLRCLRSSTGLSALGDSSRGGRGVLSLREGCPLSPGGVSSLSPGLERSGAVRCIPLDRVLECVCV